MEQKINIAEILKDAPMWTNLYSPAYGDCQFKEVNDKYNGTDIVIISEDHTSVSLDWNGHKKGIENGECIIFPSKDCRSWENFKAPWKHKHFEPFQKVLVLTRELNDGPQYYNADFYSHWDKSSELHYTVGGLRLEDSEILDYEGNEDKLGKKVSDEV